MLNILRTQLKYECQLLQWSGDGQWNFTVTNEHLELEVLHQ